MAQTIPFQNDQYYSRSWRMLTRDKGWIKPVLLLTAGCLVPILGMLVLLGYALEWARLTAWGAETAPKQSNIQIVECLKSGGRAFVVGLIWAIPAAIIVMLFAWLPPISPILSLALSILSTVAMLRATIFQSISAGLQLNRIFEMVKHDWKGLARIAIGSLVIGVIVVILSSMLFGIGLVALVPTMGDLFYEIGYISQSGTITAGEAVGITMQLIGRFGPMMIVIGAIIAVVSTIISLVTTNAIGLWMLQFNVPAWGASEDPLPTPLAPLPPYGQAPGVPVVPRDGDISASVRMAGGHEVTNDAAQYPTQYPQADAYAAPELAAPQEEAPAAPQPAIAEETVQPLVNPMPQAAAPAEGEIPVVPVVPVASAEPAEADVPAMVEQAAATEEAPAAASTRKTIDDATAQAEAYAEAVEAVARETGVAPEEIAASSAAKKTTRRSTTRKTAAKKAADEEAPADDAAEQAAPAKKTTARKTSTTAKKTTTKKTSTAAKSTTAKKTTAAKKAEDADAPAADEKPAAKKTSTTAKKTTAKKTTTAAKSTTAKKTSAAAKADDEEPKATTTRKRATTSKSTTAKESTAKASTAKKTTSTAKKSTASSTAKKTSTRSASAEKDGEDTASAPKTRRSTPKKETEEPTEE